MGRHIVICGSPLQHLGGVRRVCREAVKHTPESIILNFSRYYIRIRKIVRAALIAAVYVVLCLVLAPLSYGTIQVRVSEALTLLPVLCPEAIIGVAIGCFLSNMIASAPVDMIVGTIATLLAALVTYKLRAVRWKGLAIAGSIPPVLFNAVIVGIELTLLYYPANSAAAIWLLNIASVGAGQIVSCSILGVLLVYIIEKNPTLLRLFKDSNEGRLTK